MKLCGGNMCEKTIPELFFENVDRFSERVALMSKRGGVWEKKSYRKVGNIVRKLSLMLNAWGVRKGDHVAIISENREEWVITDMAIISIGAVNVPIYPTLSEEQIRFILEDAKPRILFLSGEELYGKIEKIGYRFEEVVAFEQFQTDGVVFFQDLIKDADRINEDSLATFTSLMKEVSPDDLVCINYTSGTTGKPKGVMLTHRNFVFDILNSTKIVKIVPEDRFLSFLPLSHVLERMGGYYTPLLCGASIAFAESLEKIVENMKEVSPTILVSVPRLFEKIYSGVLTNIESASRLKKKIFHWSVRAGKLRIKKEVGGAKLNALERFKLSVADKLVFSKLREFTGGKLERFISGGAPLSKEIAEFFWAAGMKIYEGYGLTETAPVLTLNGPGRVRLGSVGKAIPGTEIKIARDGEILVKGGQVMKGYYKNEEATREVIDGEGFFHTGDIGYLDEEGFLFITDRKKNIIVTAGGKNVAPQPVEDAIKQSPYIAEAILVGDGRKFISALIVLDRENIRGWALENGVEMEPYERFVRDERLVEFISKEIERRTERFSNFERVKKFRILPRDLTMEENELTPSLKVRRRVVLEHFADVVDEMYRE
ncbi:MAG: long-chain fatty acid--CoA ligase [Candidatus Neomarinimicrobiota bacterium]|nr:MAG: long-chain fatty acid--CoA ligase [Candidatus Neomarinimicrobiota bacterium]